VDAVKPEAVATIAVRLLGLFLAIFLIENVLRSSADVIMRLTGLRPSSRAGIATAVSYVGPASAAVVFALGLYMFLSGKWFIRRIVRGLGPPPEGICAGCGYDLAGLRVSRCPECGEKLPKGVVTAAASGRSNARAARP
jgi:hypothetical protein